MEDVGYLHPTPIQEQAIPIVLMGRDVLGCAQTGTGKTASFVLPMMDILAGSRAKARMPRSLILEPTRELALQVAENFVKYGQHMKLTHALLIGGESMAEQTDALNQGVDVLIATPGRLIDLFERGRVMLADCKILVIDEADRMLDMGFIPDVERIVTLLPPLRQTLFFSATMAPEIRKLADAFLQNPKEITVSRPASVATTITTGLALVPEHDKRRALRKLLRRESVQNALIFCNRKRDVDILYKSLSKHGFSVGALHGDLAQSVRFATLEKFKNNEVQLLVCSDVAARGIDIGGLSHVFNFDLPFHAEDYVHRIGRTGRAGREGHAYSIATADDAKLLAAIEGLTGKEIPRIAIDGIETVSEEELAEARESKGRGRGRGGKDSRGKDGRGKREEEPRGGRRDEAPRRGRRRDEDENRQRERGAEAAAAAPQEEKQRVRDDRRRHNEEERSRARDDHRRDEHRRDRRDRDDLGPPVVGFGDAVPAFMLIPIPKPKRDARPAEADPEAA
ncbi:putative ATP-dependent RNA helicase RhlE [Acetobacteraceae bacterium AT-5844]|nr:putative ATP-dependent RNA helicase RhlE [Acetobacteraceae bacterium AT-5844]